MRSINKSYFIKANAFILCLMLLIITSGCSNTLFKSIGSKAVNPWEKLEFTVELLPTAVDAKVSAIGDLAKHFDAATRTFSWTPGPDDDGEYLLEIIVSSGEKKEREIIPITVSALEDLEFDYLQTPSQADYPGADAVYLRKLVDIDCTYKENGKNLQATLVSAIIKVFNKQGIEKHGELRFNVNMEAQYAAIGEAKTIRPDGKVFEVDDNAIHVVTPPELTTANVYSDTKQVVINMPSLEEGSIIVYQYVIIEPLEDNEFWLWEDLQTTDPIKYSRVELKTPGAIPPIPLKYVTLNNDNIHPVIDVDAIKKTTTYTWVGNDLAPIMWEVGMPSPTNLLTMVMASTIQSWDDISKWYVEYLKDKYITNKTIDDKVNELTAGMTDPQLKTKAIFDWVATNIRYVSVAYGEGGYEPRTASSIYENKYGDCKDKSILLIAMLKVAGVLGEPVLVNTYFNPDFSIISPALFNHMIVYIRELDMFLDPTSDVDIYGQLPYAVQGKNVYLPVANETKVVPTSTAAQNVVAVEETVNIASTGTAAVVTKKRYTGAEDAMVKSMMSGLDQTQRDTTLREMLTDSFPNMDIVDYSVQTVGTKGLVEPVGVNYTFTINAYANNIGNRIIFKPLSVPDIYGSLVTTAKRSTPIDIDYACSYVKTVTIQLPQGATIDFMPGNINIHNDVGSLVVEYSLVGQSQINVAFSLVLNKALTRVDEYDQFKQLINQVQQVNRNQVILNM